MDDASSLISDLLAKLADLDDKVASYRKDMTAEFQRYSDDLLRHVPAKVSDEVKSAIAVASRSGRYSSLYPDDQDPAGRSTPTGTSAADEPPASPTIDRTRWDGHNPSPPPVLHHTSGTPTSTSLAGVVNSRALGSNPRDGPARDPHAREREFHGLFTPSYLPLLESSDRISYSQPPPVPAPALEPAIETATATAPAASLPVASADPSSSEALQAVKGLSTPTTATDSSTNSPTMANSGRLAPRIPPVRSFTDPSVDCGAGGDRESPRRRSALRRSSSSSNRTSPRRGWQDETAAAAGSLPVVTTTQASPTSRPRDSLLGPTASIFDDGDEASPPPKKVSSSQALRALSKLPLENPGTWTVVNPSSDLVTPLFGGTRPAAQAAASFPATNTAFTNKMATAHTRLRAPLDPDDLEIQSVTNIQLGSPLQDLEAYPDDDSSDSDDDFVSMPIRQGRKKSTSPESHSPLPPVSPSGTADAQGQSASSDAVVGGTKTMPTPETPGKNEVNGKSAKTVKNPKFGDKCVAYAASDVDGEDFFEMDDDDSATRTKRETRHYIEEDESEPDAEAVDTAEAAAQAAAVEAQVLSHSLTPSRPFTGGGDPFGSPTTVPVSVGSYKGRPISFDIIKDPMVHQKAAELGNLPTFVGSVHDSADPTSSFRGGHSLSGGGGSNAFTGTPRSLVERMMLEEMADQGGVPTRR
ncbi:hypothetical protein MAPG_06422 [Magnaporthiopsis poae ATCC 64411]|uniref:Uncharacterized protein n=1 Tax=Magnaporthiopsis poae (strain ATCC 64411 / 73-15) TaxID=644358 RepID=A0A0C4E1Z6_MAGP6|nr:hypothetical protein MAPG_06422 [Magnaporthiopsis poae ATCC 64411]